MTWFSVALAVLAAVLLLGVVGIPLGWLLGLRRLALCAAAPAFAVTVIGGSAVIAPWVGLSWSILPVLIVMLGIAAVIAALRYLTRKSRGASAPRRRADWWVVAALVAAAVLIGTRVIAILGAPDAISQTFDDIFHLNAVRFVLDTGSASSLTIGRLTNPGGALGFYPAAWHGLVSLVVQLSGAGIPAAVNAVTLVVSAVIWPLGVIFLTRTLFGRSPALSIGAGLLAASIPLFPILLMDYGVLYPYQLGVALLPFALAATARLLGVGRGRARSGRLWWGIALLGALPGLALAHPGSFVAWLALSAPMAAVFIVDRWRTAASRRARAILSLGTLVYLAAGMLLVIYLRPPGEARGWPTQRTVGEAILDVLTVSAWYAVPAIAAAIAVAAGIVWAIRVHSAPALVALGVYAVAGILFVIVASLPFWLLRDAFTGPWYNNIPRLAALLPIAMVPLGAYGIACTTLLVRRAGPVRRLLARAPRAIGAVIGILAALVGAVLLQLPALSPLATAQTWASFAFQSGPGAPLLSRDEATLLSRVDQHVPEGVAIAGSPWTGASLAYALADRPVLMPHTLMEITDELQTINDGLAAAEPGGAVCDALDELGVGFVLDFGPGEVHGGEHVFPGLSALAESGAVRLVDQEGDARLYEIVACTS